jgi:hypothetical protein
MKTMNGLQIQKSSLALVDVAPEAGVAWGAARETRIG